jgi:hypothetical protein
MAFQNPRVMKNDPMVCVDVDSQPLCSDGTSSRLVDQAIPTD